eukprot:scaffold43062_cov206-Amphora_coffeaeformis.AAC.4
MMIDRCGVSGRRMYLQQHNNMISPRIGQSQRFSLGSLLSVYWILLAWLLLARQGGVQARARAGNISPPSWQARRQGSSWPWIAPNTPLTRLLSCRGGASSERKTKKKTVFRPLAQALLPYLLEQDGNKEDVTIEDVTNALEALASSQQTFKGLDGVAHEAYQRTHTKEDISLHVSGRAMRTVARTQAVAVGLGACELCELVAGAAAVDDNINSSDALALYQNGTLANKQILLREKITVKYQKKSLNVTVLVLYEPDYHGGAGVEHGSLFGEKPSKIYHGRLLVVLGTADTSIDDMLQVLGLPAQLVALQTTQQEAASVQPLLFRAASQVLQNMDSAVRPYNTSAIHIVGHSLAGGITTLLATMLEGHLAPNKGTATNRSRSKKKITKQSHGTKMTDETKEDASNTTTIFGAGWGRGRTSAVVLGAPPSVSANVPADTLVTSIVYGDDWVSRTTDTSLKRLLARVQPILKRRRSLLTKRVALFGDMVKLATQGLTAHAHGREGEECRLTSTTGSQAYLLRPRRYGNHVSIHEMGRSSGREAIRAAVLWQLSDILLSPSYAKHHTLDSYIHGLDRVHVRGLDDDIM